MDWSNKKFEKGDRYKPITDGCQDSLDHLLLNALYIISNITNISANEKHKVDSKYYQPKLTECNLKPSLDQRTIGHLDPSFDHHPIKYGDVIVHRNYSIDEPSDDITSFNLEKFFKYLFGKKSVFGKFITQFGNLIEEIYDCKECEQVLDFIEESNMGGELNLIPKGIKEYKAGIPSPLITTIYDGFIMDGKTKKITKDRKSLDSELDFFFRLKTRDHEHGPPEKYYPIFILIGIWNVSAEFIKTGNTPLIFDRGWGSMHGFISFPSKYEAKNESNRWSSILIPSTVNKSVFCENFYVNLSAVILQTKEPNFVIYISTTIEYPKIKDLLEFRNIEKLVYESDEEILRAALFMRDALYYSYLHSPTKYRIAY